MIFKDNLLEIYKNYTHFIIDIWGVIHDGTHIYPGVIENLQEIRSAGKKICFLSNAPRRSIKAETLLNDFGIKKELYDFILTSGEATYLYLKDNKELSHKYFYMGPDKDLDLLEDLDYQMCSMKDAKFIINTGLGDEFLTVESRMKDLQEGIKYDLPMICVNPDLIVIKQSGLEILCAGILAKKYQELGGRVTYFGKPHKLVYDKVRELFGSDENDKFIAIGDGIETDIKGANENNIDSALIGGGILSNRLNIKYRQLPTLENMKGVCQEYGIRPDFVLSGL
ncbi:TIGR01459 family HAD-type hydrolase [Rickettsiales bacterium]|nr:TIGR01459 family HAD-type hydrolase [Rickettsiales bacterium]